MSYSNEDLAYIPKDKRTWTTSNYAWLWFGMSFSIPAYMLASSLIVGGMSWWQALLAIFLGNSIVLIPMILNSHAGTKYGIPFPIYIRASFGVRGANIPAIIRALIACGWFGIQAWIGGEAVYELIKVFYPSFNQLPSLLPDFVGLTTAHALSFFIFWLINIVVIFKGMELMKKLLGLQSLLLGLITVGAIVWAFFVPQSFHSLLSHQSNFKTNTEFWTFFCISLTSIVGFFSTISLNIPDFTRYAVSQRAQIIGQSISLPTAMTIVTFIGVFVTTTSYELIHELIWDPVVLAGRIPYDWVKVLLMMVIIFVTLVANVALNIVSPANDFAHLKPKLISFKTGGVITAVIAMLIMPWKLIKDPNGYVFIWLTGVSALLGSIVGIMLSDYFLLRKTHLDLDGLYHEKPRYWYYKGFNLTALLALTIGVLPNLPGFLVQVKLLDKAKVAPLFLLSYDYAWFVGLFISGVIYLILMRCFHHE